MSAIIPTIPRPRDIHERTGVDISQQRVIPGDPPITMCPFGTCMACVPIAVFWDHLEGHANRGERV